MGESGAGKSLLLRVLAGIVDAERVSIAVDGAAHPELKHVRRDLAAPAAGPAGVRAQVATSAEAAATERALREDVSPDRLFVQVRGSKRATRWRKVPIVASWQRELLDLALGHAQGRDGRLFLPRTKFGQTLERACARAGIPRCTPNDLRRT